MKKVLLIICVAIATLNMSAYNVETSVSTSTGTNWSKSDNGITECGGTYNGTPYKAISMYIENVPSEEKVKQPELMRTICS